MLDSSCNRVSKDVAVNNVVGAFAAGGASDAIDASDSSVSDATADLTSSLAGEDVVSTGMEGGG